MVLLGLTLSRIAATRPFLPTEWLQVSKMVLIGGKMTTLGRKMTTLGETTLPIVVVDVFEHVHLLLQESFARAMAKW